MGSLMELGRIEWRKSEPRKEKSSMLRHLASAISVTFVLFGPAMLGQLGVRRSPGDVEDDSSVGFVVEDDQDEVDDVCAEGVEHVEAFELSVETLEDVVQDHSVVFLRLEDEEEEVGRHPPEEELDEFVGDADVVILGVHLDAEARASHLHVRVRKHVFDEQREVQVVVKDLLRVLDEALVQSGLVPGLALCLRDSIESVEDVLVEVRPAGSGMPTRCSVSRRSAGRRGCSV